MGLLQTQIQGRREGFDDGSPEQHHPPRFAAADEQDGRHEPQSLLERSFPLDPYAVWLAQREAEAEAERERTPQIRLVHRPRGGESGIVARRL